MPADYTDRRLYANGTHYVVAASTDDAHDAAPSVTPYTRVDDTAIISIDGVRRTALDWARLSPRGILCAMAAVLLAVLGLVAWGWTRGAVDTRPTATDEVQP